MILNHWEEYVSEYTGHDEWHSVYTITVGELYESGVFDWSRPELDWSSAAYDQQQYERVCSYFIERFYYREISLEPFAEWARMLKRKFVYELMPKYAPLYKRVAEGISPLQAGDEYHKSRRVDSSYPQTLLSGNSDYLTSGNDLEEETLREGDLVDAINKYAMEFHSVDELLLNEFETMFISMYTANVNATW